ncbi:MAG: hypothetical protein AAFY56_13280 [Pseudomonadota bacterium]
MKSLRTVGTCLVIVLSLASCANELKHRELSSAEVPYDYDVPTGAEVSHELFQEPRIGTTYYLTEVSTAEDLTLIFKIDTPANRVLVKSSPAEDAGNWIHDGEVSWMGVETSRSTGAGYMQVQPYRIHQDQASCVAVQSFAKPTFDDSLRELYHESLIAIRCHEGQEPVSSAQLNDMLTRLKGEGR